MQLAFFHAKDIQIFFGKLLILYLEMTQMAGKGGWVMLFALLWHNAYENRYVIRP